MAQYDGSQTAIIPDVFPREIQQAVYEAKVIEPTFKNLGESGERIHVRKFGALGRTSLATGATSDLRAANLTLQSGVDVDTTATPTTSYLAVGMTVPFIGRMLSDPTSSFRQAAAASIAEGIDVACATLFDDLTSVVGGVGVDVTEATFLDGLVAIKNAAKAAANPGNRVFVFHHNQLDDVIASTQNWAQWQIRGDKDNPVATGELKSVYGFRLIESGNIQNIGGLFHNGMYVPGMTFGIGYNVPVTTMLQENGLVKLLIIVTDFVVVTIWSDRGCDYQTQVTA